MAAFPDQIHVERIAEALWRKSPLGNAALMVGAGLSRNARNIADPGRMMPTWSELAESLCEKLYPAHDSSLTKQRNQSLKKANSTSGALRLAQEFEASFGRTELNRLLKIFTPDNDYAPSDLHADLLKLPWADVFTTNWDTLLERTVDAVVDRKYDVVRCHDDIPASQQPRIVKLHGSFPSNYPFIFSEEDYRTYPTRFAHFVNMAQQSMMENLFCLIGFSGDDPNFLHWTGWVRDNLGESAPKIYFVGWLELAPAQRRMLEDRNVVPVDLSRLPQGMKWPEECRHRYSLEWFLWMLKLKRPSTRKKSSILQGLTKHPPEYLEITSDRFVVERGERRFSPDVIGPNKDKERLKEIREQIPIWRSERIEYEGWIVAPSYVRDLFWTYTKDWVADVGMVAHLMPPWERLLVLREIVWRLQVCLSPLFDDELIQKISLVLDDIDPNQRKCRWDGKDAETAELDWPAIRDAWFEVAIALLSHYRQEWLTKKFEALATKIEKLRGCKNSSDALIYQQVMLKLQTMNYTELGKILQLWHVEDSDHIWGIRKAGILFEIGESEAAYALLSDTLPAIRRSIQRDSDDFAALSREGCAMQLLEIAGWEKRYIGPEERDEREKVDTHNPDWAARWKILLAADCDIREEWQKLCSMLEVEPPDPRVNRETRERGFDLGTVSTGQHFGAGGQLLPAYQALAFTEVSGMPPYIKTGVSGIVVGSHGLNRAALWLKSSEPEIAFRILLRTCTSETDKTLKAVATRETVALMDKISTEELTIVSMKGIKEIAKSINYDKKRLEKLRVAMELLSRLTIRLSDIEKQKKVFDLAISLAHNLEVSGHLWLAGALSNLLNRSVKTINLQAQADLILPLLKLPTEGIDEMTFSSESWWGILFNIKEQVIQSHRKDQEGDWREIIGHLLVQAGKKASRRRAVWRLDFLHRNGVLSKQEQRAFGEKLWASEFRTATNLPGKTDLRPWVFLDLPSPEENLAEISIRKAYLTKEGAEKASLSDYLKEIGSIANLARKRKQLSTLTPQEASVVMSEVAKWAEQEILPPSHSLARQSSANAEMPKLVGVAEVLPFLSPSEEELELIKVHIDSLEAGGIACYLIYPPLISQQSELAERYIPSLKKGLASDDPDCAANAIHALSYWLSLAETGHAGLPPEDIIEEVGIVISLRHEPVLAPALRFAALLFEKQPDIARKVISRRTLQGLGYLFGVCDYRQAIKTGLTEKIDIPLVRYSCVKLAIAMEHAGYSGEAELSNWLEAAKEDPLAEVRNLVQGNMEAVWF